MLFNGAQITVKKSCFKGIGALSAAMLGVSALALAPVIASASSLDVKSAKAAVDKDLDADYPHLDALYKDIHAHAELGFQEHRTAAILAKEMRSLGYEVTEGVGQTGIVAVLKNGAGPTVLVRTELDALPLQEKTGLPYASQNKQTVNGVETYVDHACGHDIHMAVWVGVARVMSTMKDRWQGTVVFIGQPAEETIGGASAMLKDGLLTRFPKPDLGFGLHVGPSAYGEVAYKSGVSTSNSDSFEILFKGRGGHGSMPSMTIDPIVESARFVVDVQTVISREKDAAAFGVITVGSIHAGNAGNIIPDQATLRGTIRSYTPEVRSRLIEGLERTARGEAAISNAPEPQISVVSGGRAVVNDAAITQKTAKVFKAAFGDQAVEFTSPGAASEDYSEYIIAGVPSLFFSIGGADPAAVAAAKAGGKPVPINHSPYFAPVPEPTIRTGVEAMSLALFNTLHR